MGDSVWLRRPVGVAVVGLVVMGSVAAMTTTAGPVAARESAAPESAPTPQLLAQGSYHTCAIVDAGKVKCWGRNDKGQLGLGDTADRGDGQAEMGSHLPVVALGTGRTAVSVAVGYLHSCAVLDNGQVKCWGANDKGQLGLGDTFNRGDGPGEMGDSLPPVDLGTGRTATAVTAGFGFTCALLDNGQIKCWGFNGNGRLGLGNTSDRGDGPGEMGDNLPAVAFRPATTATAVSAGAGHVCALVASGSVACWGYSGNGELGYGGTFDQGNDPWETPMFYGVDLGTGRTATALSAGWGHTCAILDNGAVKCWGYNGDSRLGLGDTNNRGDTNNGEMGNALPAVNLGTGRTATAIDAGDGHVCAILDNASLKCWGLNGAGQLGLGDKVTRGTSLAQMGDSLPAVNLGTGRTATAITAGSGTCARLDDGTVRCWGLNDHGQLGLGDTANRGDDGGEMASGLPAVHITPAHSITIALDTGSDTPQDFGFTGCAGPNACGQFSLDHDSDPTLSSIGSVSSLAQGTYTVTQAAVPNWTLTAITCDTPATVDLAARRVTIQLGADDDISCTFSVRSASITIVQDTVPDVAQDFSFTGCLGQGCSTFALDDDTDPTLPRSVTGLGLAPGAYTITQTSPGAGWPLQNLTCDTPETVDLASRRVTITLVAGQNVTCTFTNKPTMITIVQDSAPDSAQDFGFTGCLGQGCGTFSLDDDADATLPSSMVGVGLAEGTYTVTQTVPAGWVLLGLTCSTGGTASFPGARATITLTPGQQVTCTFQDGQRPANDALAGATALTDPPWSPIGNVLTLVATNVAASKEADEPNHAGDPGGHSLWYKFGPLTSTHMMYFNTCDAPTTFDTTIGVYATATPSLSLLAPVTSNDDGCPPDIPPNHGSVVSFLAVYGNTYWIAVDGHGDATGAFELGWEAGPPVPPPF